MEEYERIKKRIITDLVFYSEKPLNRAKMYCSMALLDIYPKSNHKIELEKIKKVTRKDIKKAAEQVFSGDFKVGLLSKNITGQQVSSIW